MAGSEETEASRYTKIRGCLQDRDETEDGGGEDKLEGDEEVEVEERDAAEQKAGQLVYMATSAIASAYPLPMVTTTLASILARAAR